MVCFLFFCLSVAVFLFSRGKRGKYGCGHFGCGEGRAKAPILKENNCKNHFFRQAAAQNVYLIAHCHVSVGCARFPRGSFSSPFWARTRHWSQFWYYFFIAKKSELLLLNILSARQYSLQSRLRAFTAAQKTQIWMEKHSLLSLNSAFFIFYCYFAGWFL